MRVDVQSPVRPQGGTTSLGEPSRDLRPLLQLLQLVKPYWARFWVAAVALLASTGLGLVYPQVARYAVDISSTAKSLSHLNELSVVLVVVFGLQAGLIWIRHYQMSWLGMRVVADLRTRAFDKLLTLPPTWFHQRHTGEILSRLSSDVTVVEGLVGSELSMALRHSVTLIGGIILLLFENWKLTLVMLAVVPPLAIFVVRFGRKVRGMARGIQDRLAAAGIRAQEVLGAIQTVQAFVRELDEGKAYRQRIGEAVDAQRGLIMWRSSFMALFTFAVSLSITIVVWVGGRAVLQGELSAGDLAAFLLYTAMVASSVAALASLGGSLQRAAGSTDRVFEILGEMSNIADPADPLALPDGKGHVRFDHVEFTYPTRLDRQVIQDVTLDVPAGKWIALVGSSGAGKSTLAALLQRFFDVSAGTVQLDGVDVRHLRLADLRRSIAIVSQEPVLFSGSIAENIAYGLPNATQEQIESAARDAHAHDFITSFSSGYATLVGERGVQLSGGQRQRVAIARALLADPRVLILDEATSNLDAESEALVQKALARLMQGRTALIIAHRLSTVRSAHAIAVLDNGKLVELGNHDQLLGQGGTYKRLIEHQVFAGQAVN
ncbi:MAG: ATP-binding cassette domain-containing protein [Myxococcales bacterium]|nr:ATP-binding cassette domain-containing protein [Myxococcales bacterium]